MSSRPASREIVDYYSEQIDLARFPEPDYPAALRQFLRTKYSQQHFDVIIATSVAMLEFVTAAGNELFPGVPIVFSGSPNSHAGPRSTGITSSLEFKETLDLAVTLQPDVQRVLVVTGVPPGTRAMRLSPARPSTVSTVD